MKHDTKGAVAAAEREVCGMLRTLPQETNAVECRGVKSRAKLQPLGGFATYLRLIFN